MESRMSRLVFPLLIVGALAGVLAPQPVHGQTFVYLIDSTHGVATEVYRVKPSTGQMRLLGTVPAELGEAAGLAAASPSLLYVSTVLGQIARIDLSPTFVVTPLGSVGGKLALLHTDGAGLLAVDEESNQLVRIGLDPLVKDVVGTIRTGSTRGPVVDVIGGDLARTGAGSWYMFTNGSTRSDGNGKLYLLDPNTAVATLLGPRGWAYGRISGLAFDPTDGTLYASARDLDKLLMLSPITGLPFFSSTLCRGCPGRYDVSAGDLAIAAMPTLTPRPTRTPTPTRRP